MDDQPVEVPAGDGPAEASGPDHPAEPTGSAPDDGGWGSPLPAAYGALGDSGPPPREGSEPSSYVPSWLRARTHEPGLLRRFQTGETPVVAGAGAGAGGLGLDLDSWAPAPDTGRPDTGRADAGRPDAGRADIGRSGPVGEPSAARTAAGAVPVGAGPADQAESPTAVTPSVGSGGGSDLGPPPQPLPVGRRDRRAQRRLGRTRTRATVRHVSVWSVARVSIVYYVVVLAVLVVADVLLWFAADAFGSLPSVEKSIRSLFSLKTFDLHVGTVALFSAAAGVVLCVFGTLANILLAVIYNSIADLVGGVRVELESAPRD